MYRLALSPALPGPLARDISLGYGADGKRIRRKVSATTKAGVLDKLKELAGDIDAGVRKVPAGYTVRRAAADWLAEGLPGRVPKPVRTYDDVLVGDLRQALRSG